MIVTVLTPGDTTQTYPKQMYLLVEAFILEKAAGNKQIQYQ